MAYTPPYHYQWQNPELVKTIYPFRLEKLRDFLLYYREIDLWKQQRNLPVDKNMAIEVVQEISRLNLEYESSKKSLEEAKVKLKELEKKNREALRNPAILRLEQLRNTLQGKLPKQSTLIRSLNDSVTWYKNYAKTHPEVIESIAYKRRVEDLQEAEKAYQDLHAQIEKANSDRSAELAKVGLQGFENDRARLQQQMTELSDKINRLTEDINRLPKVGKTGDINAATAVQWQVRKYGEELKGWDQAQLIEAVLKRFNSEPQRFPTWLQYMILHFSGMRYKSAHGSWASPRDLLEMVRIEEYEKWVKTRAASTDLDKECALAIQALEQSKPAAKRPVDLERIKWQIVALNDKSNRQTALIKFKSPIISQEVRSLSEEKVLEGIKALKDIFPPWVWKEVVSRTELRLEVSDANWEELTPEERQARWEWKSGYWREIMESWEGKDITGWRKQHEMTLSLVVTRAVCNEIAEHIQHLRGVTPAAGLTAKPAWYLKEQNAARKKPPLAGADQPYFKAPGQQSKADFKPGASILWLGWVYQKPNPWQITRPLDGVGTLPPRDAWASYPWNYKQEGSEFVREANVSTRPQPATNKKGKGRPGDSQLLKNWLRWTHEAIVVEVAEMAGGVDYVLTFETGQIGLRLRSLKELLNNPYVYVGYVPPAPQEPESLAKMLARDKLVPSRPATAPRDLSFEAPEFIAEELPAVEPLTDEKKGIWQSLTPRELQVVTLICGGKTTGEIAERMEIKSSTVKKHLHNAMRKFGVHSRTELRQIVAEHS